MTEITNEHGIDILALAWLLVDDYDHDSGKDIAPKGKLLSASQLLKSTKAIVLSKRVDYSTEVMDISERSSSCIGQSLHNAVEGVWTSGQYKESLKLANIPQDIIDSIVVNPDPNGIPEGKVPAYFEQRGFKEICGYTIKGKFDAVFDGNLRDLKTTSTYNWTSGNNDENYKLQGSIYKWIFPEIITGDKIKIVFMFNDWTKGRAENNPDYPPSKVSHKYYNLLTEEETQSWLENKVTKIDEHMDMHQDDMIRCTDKELWRNPPIYKYYSKPESALKPNARATKNFDSLAEAEKYKQEKGRGVVVTKYGEVKACTYCNAFSICNQRKEYFSDE